MPKVYRPTEDLALARCKNLTAEDIIRNREKAQKTKEVKMRIGLFSSPGSRGTGSAEAQVLCSEPLDREEIQQVLHHSNSGTVVETKNGRVVTLTNSEAKRLLGR